MLVSSVNGMKINIKLGANNIEISERPTEIIYTCNVTLRH